MDICKLIEIEDKKNVEFNYKLFNIFFFCNNLYLTNEMPIKQAHSKCVIKMRTGFSLLIIYLYGK